MTGRRRILGGVEGGGTKFVCAVGSGPDDLRAEVRISTTGPEETLGAVAEFLRQAAADEPLAAVGIACFGPAGIDPDGSDFGRVTSTIKPGWEGADVVGPVARALGVPVGFDTDVNGAALGEQRWGAGQGLDTFLYLTVGTGIGGGAVVNGRPVHGLLHPEMGHLTIPRRDDDEFSGSCRYHGACLEGLAAGPAIEHRWGAKAETLPADHPAWELEAHYLALGIANLVLALSPQRVIVGGGVMEQPRLLPLIRRKAQALLSPYLRVPALTDLIDEFIVPPGLGRRAGVLGALVLAERAAAASR